MIKILPENIANKIAAGEVVERPASVVKELVENSLDSGASRIFIETGGGGTKVIKIIDDGSGMSPDDALLAFERHATSKLSSDESLLSISTMGFRGEALPSIASVSRFRLTTSTGEGHGSLISIEGGKIQGVKEVGAARGTTAEVRDLFFNTPARLKFLKSRETELSHIAATVERLALAHHEIHFRLTSDGKELFDCPPVRELKDRVAQVYGRDFAKGLSEINNGAGACRVHGFVSAPGSTFSDRSRQETFVNRRPVKDRVITRALYDAYESLLMKERHPASILFIDIEPSQVDVNVHPAKREVRFADAQGLQRTIKEAVICALKVSECAPGPDAFMDAGTVREASAPFAPPSGWPPVTYRDDAGSFPVYEHRQERIPLHTERNLHPEPEREMGREFPMQVLDSYIIARGEDGFILIDQHAAHERVQYEKVKARFGKHGESSQGLLVPERIELTAKEAALLEAVLPELKELGIDAEPFGGGSFLIRSKPLFLEKADIKEVVLGLVSELESADVKGKAEELREKICKSVACKSAVKAGKKLHPYAMERLIEQLFACEMPYTCAHGRPTVIKFGLNELEKMFKRK
jgi:DNA mismatch repair protein MutL